MYAITAATLLALATRSLAEAVPPPPPGGYQGPSPPPPGYQGPSPPPPGGVKPTQTKIITASSPTSTCDQTICVDYINDCGQWYGGCYNDCPGAPKPTFSDPGCPTTTSEPVFSILPFPPFTTTTTTSEQMFSILPYPPFTTSKTSTCTQTICADYVNDCGQWYGGCYAACPGSPTPTFVPPPCSTSKTTSATITTSKPTSTKLPSTSTTCTQTICADFINECGQLYGGCYAACPGLPTPTFTPPPCTKSSTTSKPTTSSKPTTTIKPSSLSTTCTQTLCADYVNECGQWYGGCYAVCPGLPTPTFTPPPCTKPTIVPVTTTSSSKKPSSTTCTQTICVDKVNSCGIKYGGCYANCPDSPPPTFTTPPCPTTTTVKTTGKPTSTTCTQTICVDKVNSCGIKYGGCYANCPDSPPPTFTTPSCPTTTTTKVTTITSKPSSSSTCTQTICVDKINSCGLTYGGCYANCPGLPTPTFSPPPCPTTTTTATTASITSKVSTIITSLIATATLAKPTTAKGYYL